MQKPRTSQDTTHSLRARIGGLALAASHDPREYTAAGRAAFLSRFDEQVDPEGVLPLAERARRAEAARKLYFAKLSLQSAMARRKADYSVVACTLARRSLFCQLPGCGRSPGGCGRSPGGSCSVQSWVLALSTGLWRVGPRANTPGLKEVGKKVSPLC